MNIIITILLVIVGIIALVYIASLFLSKEYSFYREVVINKPLPEVFDYVKHLKNQDNYSKWVMADPDKKKEFKGTDGQVGFVYAWDSTDKNVGKGEQEITSITDGKQIAAEVRFERPFKGVSNSTFETEQVSGQTQVRWIFSGTRNYPANLLLKGFDKMLGNDIQTSLNTLKTVLEK